jgi:sec-independent protein translocase protein TatA
MIQGPQLIIVLAIILLLFGGSKLPKLARSLGQAQKEFREGLKEGEATDSSSAGSSSAGPSSAAPSTANAATDGATQTDPKDPSQAG